MSDRRHTVEAPPQDRRSFILYLHGHMPHFEPGTDWQITVWTCSRPSGQTPVGDVTHARGGADVRTQLQLHCPSLRRTEEVEKDTHTAEWSNMRVLGCATAQEGSRGVGWMLMNINASRGQRSPPPQYWPAAVITWLQVNSKLSKFPGLRHFVWTPKQTGRQQTSLNTAFHLQNFHFLHGGEVKKQGCTSEQRNVAEISK